jgi:molybdopterin-guanine dinucleotide biosynthesis protein B
VLLLGNDRWTLMHELRGADEPSLDYLLNRMQHCDLVLMEGFETGGFPKRLPRALISPIPQRSLLS